MKKYYDKILNAKTSVFWVFLLVLLYLQQFVFHYDLSKIDMYSNRPLQSPHNGSIEIDVYPIRGPLPWKVLSKELKDAYTLGGKIYVASFYLFGKEKIAEDVEIVFSQNFGYHWSLKTVTDMIETVKVGNHLNSISAYGSQADSIFYGAFAKYEVKGLDVLVIGSESPWIESFCIAYGAKSVTTVDFNVPILESGVPIKAVSIEELAASEEKFDVVISYSSIEHDGLGRYGDPLNPNGDIERVKRIKYILREKGKFYLGVPMGNDTLTWNAHRVYGNIRFPLLIQGWRLIDTIGLYDFDKVDELGYDQPLHILELP